MSAEQASFTDTLLPQLSQFLDPQKAMWIAYNDTSDRFKRGLAEPGEVS